MSNDHAFSNCANNAHLCGMKFDHLSDEIFFIHRLCTLEKNIVGSNEPPVTMYCSEIIHELN